MQQRGSNVTMQSEDGDQSNPPSTRGRMNSKLKVLVRSHAMREETSPPREPSPCQQQQQQSPCIKLTPSPEDEDIATAMLSKSPPIHQKPVVVLSPLGGGSPCLSPTSTLVPTPNSRCSPQCASLEGDRLQAAGDADQPASPKYLNKNSEKQEKPSHYHHHTTVTSALRKKYCDCQTQNSEHPNCIKCTKERNFNNNLPVANNNNNSVAGSNNMLCVTTKVGNRGKLRHQSSSQGSFESSSNSPCLSRDGSSEQYTDTTGVDLELFIPETLNRNAKDRALMLRIEQELVSLAKDRCKTHYKFPPMSSYQRMLVHRCAAYFGMDHNIEPSGKCVVVNKTRNTRIPDVEFKEHIKEDVIFSEEPRRSILKRDSNSIEDYCFKSPDRAYGMENRRSKSFEEREEEYEKARRRIFNREIHEGSSEEFNWVESPWSSSECDYPSKFRLHPPEFHERRLRKLLKVHSEEIGDTLRPCVAKSYSFGGYGGNVSVLTRGDSVMSTHSAGPRLLTKQDSGASSVSWRLSPSSSGYKSQSQMSESATPSPTSTPQPICEDSRQNSGSGDSQDMSVMDKDDSQVVWAVTDIHNVPKGSIIINPQTGKPVKNPDGSIYHYDPHNPHPGLSSHPSSKPPISPQRSPVRERSVSPKKHKFISSKSSPIKKSTFINSSTSPSLPFSPPDTPATSVPCSRTYPCLQVVSSGENVSNLPQQPQHYPTFSSSYSSSVENNVPVYQQPYIVYTAPYGMSVQQQFENRIEQTQIQEMPGGTYYVSETNGQPAQAISYQQPSGPYWNQQPVTFYQHSQQPAPTPPTRFSVPLPPQGQSAYMPTGYPSPYLPQPAPPAQNPELVQVFSNQPVQMVYPNQGAPSNAAAVIYQGQQPAQMVYAHNSMYPAAYPAPAQNVPPYPHGTPTPNSCTSSSSNPAFVGVAPSEQSQGYLQLTQGMQQMNLGPVNQHSFVKAKCQSPFDVRLRPAMPKPGGGKFPHPKSMLMGSSQSSTGTSSPAATVIAGYCPPNVMPGGMYRTPPGTPPAQFAAAYPPNFGVAPMLFRQMSNSVRAPTPGTAKSSRSPTPASDVTHFDRQRMAMPPNMYQGMPYVLQTDARLVGRGQPSAYRQVAPINRQPCFDNRSFNKGRRPKGKPVCLPPAEKPV